MHCKKIHIQYRYPLRKCANKIINFVRTYLVKWFATSLLLLCGGFSYAQQDISPESFKAVFIFHILEKVEWQQQENFTEYRVAIVGNEPPLFKQLVEISKLKKINHKPVIISTSNELNKLKQYHLLFISQNSRYSVARIANKTVRTNTLLVTENSNDKKNTMINLLANKDATYSFEVNKANITFEYLKLNPDILLLGGTEMDLAELFKESAKESASQLTKLQEDLQQQQNALRESKKQLVISQAHHQSALEESENIRVKMKALAQSLLEKTQLIQLKNISIREKEGELLAIQNELKHASNMLKSNVVILDEKLITIASKAKQVSSLSDKISDSVFRRMESERSRIAKDFRSKGAEAAERIRADADRQSEIIKAEAYRDAEQIRGDGDAKATELYANAYSADEEFYSLYRSLNAYKTTFSNKGDLMVIDPSADFFKYFRQSKPE